MFMRNRRVIDLTAIEHNMKLIRAAVPQNARMMAVVKADDGHVTGNGKARPVQI